MEKEIQPLNTIDFLKQIIVQW